MKKIEFKKGEWSLLGKFYISTFIDSAFALIPLVFILYFQYKGFELGLGGYLLAIGNLAAFIFEIPTGIFADVYGRKASTLIHYFSMFLIAILIPFATQSWMLYVLFVLDGVALTFRSGAKHAWIIDNLKQNKRKDLIQNFYTKSQSILAVATIISGLLLSAILFLLPAQQPMTLFGFNFIGIDSLWFIEGFAYLSIFFLLITISEDFKPKKAKLKAKTKESVHLMKYGLRYSWQHPVIFALLVGALLSTLAGNMRFVSFQPYLIENGIHIEQFGYLMSIIVVAGIFLPFIAQRISKNIRKNVYLAIGSMVKAGLLLSLYYITGPLLTIIAWFILKNFYYIVGPIEQAYFQEHVTSKGRATIGSIENSMYSLGAFIGPLIAGLLINLQFSSRFVVAITGLFFIPIIIVYLRIK